MTLSECLVAARRRAGLTQFDLARKAELSLSSVSKIEQGRHGEILWGTVCRLADALGVSRDELPVK